MRPLLLIAAHQAFVRHDLHEFQDGGVADRLGFAERPEDVADGRSAPLPQHVQNFELGVGGTRSTEFAHRQDTTTKTFVMSTKIFVGSARTMVERYLRLPE